MVTQDTTTDKNNHPRFFDKSQTTDKQFSIKKLLQTTEGLLPMKKEPMVFGTCQTKISTFFLEFTQVEYMCVCVYARAPKVVHTHTYTHI